jgi:hypothetical protein
MRPGAPAERERLCEMSNIMCVRDHRQAMYRRVQLTLQTKPMFKLQGKQGKHDSKSQKAS